MGDVERIRLVILGGPKVGKSSIVKRFLFNSFMEKYKPTVEDLYSKEYDFGRITLKVDILDTAGDLQFPAMRRLSIATAHAFLLVYSVDDIPSFEIIKGCFLEIQEQRGDFQEIPIVVAGNKMDVEVTTVEVEFDDVSDWISGHLPTLKTKIMECSAKKDANIREVFRSFIHLSKHITMMQSQKEDETPICGLKRRLSAHAGIKATIPSSSSSTTSNNARSSSCSTPTIEPPHHHHHQQQHQQHQNFPFSGTICNSGSNSGTGGGGGGGRSSGYSTPTKAPASPSQLSPNYLSADNQEGNSPFGRNKPRSRSLIRRCSKKVKKQVQDASSGEADCRIA